MWKVIVFGAQFWAKFCCCLKALYKQVFQHIFKSKKAKNTVWEVIIRGKFGATKNGELGPDHNP